MLRSFTQKYTDESTAREFAFTFYCDLCARSWESVPIPFSHWEQSFWTKIIGLPFSLWRFQHKDAFERANREGMLYFNRCLICKRWVCDDDFLEKVNLCSGCFKNNSFLK